MLGFWIIITHLIGAYLTTSQYIQDRGPSSTLYSLISAGLYMIPFLLFLPGSILSFLALFLFRFVVVRFALIDYVIWARNLMAPKDMRVNRVYKDGILDFESASASQIASIHVGSIAIHCIFSALAVIVL